MVLASTSPYFLYNIFKNFLRNKPKRKQITDAFSYLKRQGLITIRKEHKQIYISLTDKGRQQAGRYQINDLLIKKSKQWDKKWRIVIFDINDKKRIKREAFRGKLKELGFCQLQKSVWLHPYSCQKEIELLREFFGLNQKDISVILAEKIENEKFYKSRFGLSA